MLLLLLLFLQFCPDALLLGRGPIPLFSDKCGSHRYNEARAIRDEPSHRRATEQVRAPNRAVISASVQQQDNELEEKEQNKVKRPRLEHGAAEAVEDLCYLIRLRRANRVVTKKWPMTEDL